MKKHVILLLLSFALLACHDSRREEHGGQEAIVAEDTRPSDMHTSNDAVHDTVREAIDGKDTRPPDMHTSRIALDYRGTYQGVLPCADCEGIRTTLRLDEDGSYQISYVYLGKDEERAFSSSGEYHWDTGGQVITLTGEDEPGQYFVGENILWKLDREGQRIAGDLRDLYSLRKLE